MKNSTVKKVDIEILLIQARVDEREEVTTTNRNYLNRF